MYVLERRFKSKGMYIKHTFFFRNDFMLCHAKSTMNAALYRKNVNKNAYYFISFVTSFLFKRKSPTVAFCKLSLASYINAFMLLLIYILL